MAFDSEESCSFDSSAVSESGDAPELDGGGAKTWKPKFISVTSSLA